MSTNMIELRRIINSVMREEGGSNDEVIAALREKHGSLIHAARSELENVGLRKVISEVSAKKSKVRISNQADLFDNTPRLAQLVSINVAGKFRRVPRERVDLRTLIMKYERASKGRLPNSDDVNTLYALKKMADRVGTKDISFGEAVKILSANHEDSQL